MTYTVQEHMSTSKSSTSDKNGLFSKNMQRSIWRRKSAYVCSDIQKTESFSNESVGFCEMCCGSTVSFFEIIFAAQKEQSSV